MAGGDYEARLKMSRFSPAVISSNEGVRTSVAADSSMAEASFSRRRATIKLAGGNDSMTACRTKWLTPEAKKAPRPNDASAKHTDLMADGDVVDSMSLW